MEKTGQGWTEPDLGFGMNSLCGLGHVAPLLSIHEDSRDVPVCDAGEALTRPRACVRAHTRLGPLLLLGWSRNLGVKQVWVQILTALICWGTLAGFSPSLNLHFLAYEMG